MVTFLHINTACYLNCMIFTFYFIVSSGTIHFPVIFSQNFVLNSFKKRFDWMPMCSHEPENYSFDIEQKIEWESVLLLLLLYNKIFGLFNGRTKLDTHWLTICTWRREHKTINNGIVRERIRKSEKYHTFDDIAQMQAKRKIERNKIIIWRWRWWRRRRPRQRWHQRHRRPILLHKIISFRHFSVLLLVFFSRKREKTQIIGFEFFVSVRCEDRP